MLAVWLAAGMVPTVSQPSTPVSPEEMRVEMPSAAAWEKRLSQKVTPLLPALASQELKLMLRMGSRRVWCCNSS